MLDDYLRSNDFGALLGAAKVLGKPAEIKVNITRGDIETVDAIRRKEGN